LQGRASKAWPFLFCGYPVLVMAGLVPAIHVLFVCEKIVDARHKAGHDGSADWV
jgi:hypothetical protein